METSVVQVTNVAPNCTKEQMETLFGFLGIIDSIEIFPKRIDPAISTTKAVYIKYQDPSCVGVAQHLTNTVFIDRALMCIPFVLGAIPDEATAMQYVLPASSVSTIPGLPASNDPTKMDEIRRTIYVGNLDSQAITSDQLTTFFGTCGDVRNVRMAGDQSQPTRFAFIEFASVEVAKSAMQLNGVTLGERPLIVNHSNNALAKAPPGSQPVGDATSKEIDEAMRRVREAQSLISKALEGDSKSGKKKRSRSRSRSRSRHRRRRSRSRDRSRRRRSRSRSKGRSRRSRSRSKRRSRRSGSRSKDSRSKKRSRSPKKKSRSPRKRSRSPRKRSRSPRKRSRSPNKKSSSKSHRKDRKRDKDREHDRDRKRSRRSSDKTVKNGKSDKSDKSDKPDKTDKADKEEVKNDDKTVTIEPTNPEPAPAEKNVEESSPVKEAPSPVKENGIETLVMTESIA